MTQPRIYGSKHEIYKDFAISVKFIPDYPVRNKENYILLLKKIEEDCGGEMQKIAERMINYDGHPLASHAFFLEVPSFDSAGKSMGPGFVLLAHETGLEIFIIPLAIAVGKAFKDWAAKKVFEAVFDKMRQVVADQWTDCIDPEGGWKIARVEVRTEHKGVMEISFTNFQPAQINCLRDKWDEIDHISEVNQPCFSGSLREPVKGGWGEKDLRSRDA